LVSTPAHLDHGHNLVNAVPKPASCLTTVVGSGARQSQGRTPDRL